MAKRLVIFCDGTWNQRERRVNGELRPTNVVKLMRALTPTDQNHVQQVAYYDPGVGTRGPWDRFVGGAFGIGISQNIKEAYRFLANNYSEGDHVYLFGFSRGAYTARSLSGLIGCVGLLPKTSLEYVPEAYAYYRTPPAERAGSTYKNLVFSKVPESRRSIPIRFIGVWDTVGALGIPVRGLNWISRQWVGFHNTELSGKIQFAYHALAIDERRRPFAPNLWTNQEKVNENREVLQVWFAGVHSNIGGGYDDTGLSDTALMWMVKRAEGCGLEFSPEYFRGRVHADQNGLLEDSFTLPYRLVSWSPGLRPYVRPIGTIQSPDQSGTSTFCELIHESAIERKEAPTQAYAPENLTAAIDNQVPIFREPQPSVRSHIRRRHVREAGRWAGRLVYAEATEECRMLDFSQDEGAKIQITPDLSIGGAVELESDLTGRIPVRVVWREHGLLGLQFLR